MLTSTYDVNKFYPVVIVIRTLNEGKFLFQTLSSLFNQEIDLEFKVVVVDSGSTDETLNIVNKFNQVKLIEISKNNFTYGRGLNIGLNYFKAQYAVAISGHCIPTSKHWLKNLLYPLRFNNNVKLSFGSQVGSKESRTSEYLLMQENFPNILNYNLNSEIYFNNANSAFNYEFWVNHKFDEDLIALEDLDFYLKAVNQNLKCEYVYSAQVYHIHEENNSSVFKRHFRERIVFNNLLKDKKVESSFTLFLICLKKICCDFKFALQEKKFIRAYKGIIGFRISQYYAFYLANKMKYKNHSDIDKIGSIHSLIFNFLFKNKLNLEFLKDNILSRSY